MHIALTGGYMKIKSLLKALCKERREHIKTEVELLSRYCSPEVVAEYQRTALEDVEQLESSNVLDK